MASFNEQLEEAKSCLTDRAKKALILALVKAKSKGHQYISTEHLLVALIESQGVAANVMLNFNLDATKVEGELKKLLGDKLWPI